MPAGVKISPSILSADFSKLGSEISKLEKWDNGKGKELLKASQSSWNEYMNIHEEYLTSLSGSETHVTISRITYLKHQLELTKKRAHELQSIILDY